MQYKFSDAAGKKKKCLNLSEQIKCKLKVCITRNW